MKRIVAIEQIDGVVVTVTHSNGANYLQLELPRNFTGPVFDQWWFDNRDQLNILKHLIWMDKIESLG